jgi:(1->4)-alpha-D-glucan 1-alpha-D-glucosylmutase
MIAPRATLRVQLHKDFTFADAAELAPYLARLGVSHLYVSPILTARPGSTHGYDVIDPTRVNPELGGESAFREMVAALRAEQLGLIVDIVPNHMAVGNDNQWWEDVLRHGPASRYACVFDIDWRPQNPLLFHKLLLPVLGRQYGEALAAGDLRLAASDNGWVVRYFDNRFPISPRDYPEIEQVGAAGFDASDTAGRARLHRLLERQHYRLAWWRTAGDEINWRRFFDINDLIGIRVEDAAVFEATHATLFRLYAEELIDGFRVDHVDGLTDPGGYCRRLRARLAALKPDCTPYLVVEKILGAGERLAAGWEVEGTTGYDFMDAVSAVQHDPAAAALLASLWAMLTNRPAEFAAEAIAARREILEYSFAGQLAATVQALHQVAQLRPQTRDASAAALRRALIELLTHFPVYRCYPTDDIGAAYEQAVAGRHGRAGHEFFELIISWLRNPSSALHRRAAQRFNQLSAPLAAKAIEDTAFYRYGRLISRNDVGFDAATLGIEPAAFHDRCAERRRCFPDAILATATHDHKRGEDARARLAVLSEMPAAWGETLGRWMAINAHRRGEIDGEPCPSPADEIMLYQTIVGVWPLLADLHTTLTERLAAWQQKALREAKLHTSWTAPNLRYEAAARAFLHIVMDERSRFVPEVAAFVSRIAPAGAVNGLAQVVLKLTTPGVPDVYQGCDLWDQSLVDPDNRRAVDFAARVAALAAGRSPLDLASSWPDGRVKQAVVASILELRRRQPTLFARGDYVPLTATGARANHIIAFARHHRSAALIVITPRLPLGLLADGGSILLPATVWQDTALDVPPALQGRFVSVFSGSHLMPSARLPLSVALADFPAAVYFGSK